VENVLVTGGSGQIASYIVEEFVRRGYRVFVLDPAPPLREWAGLIHDDKIVYKHGTSYDVHQIFDLATYRFKYIVDCGALLGSEELTPRLDSAAAYDFIGSRNVFELARYIGAKVFHISIEFAGYGFTDGYSVTKMAALRTAQEYAKKYGVNIVAATVHHIFSPRQKLLPARKIMPTLISYAMTGAKFRIFGSPDKMMDLLYAGDFAKVVVELLESDNTKTADKHVYDIGSGEGIRLEDLVIRTYYECGHEPNYTVTEDFRFQRPDPYRVARNDWVDDVEHVPMLRSIDKMLNWLVRQYKKKYSMEDFELAVEVYEQRHRWGV